MESTSDNEVFYECVNWDAELKECRKVIGKRNVQVKTLKEILDKKDVIIEGLKKELRYSKRLKLNLQRKDEHLKLKTDFRKLEQRVKSFERKEYEEQKSKEWLC